MNLIQKMAAKLPFLHKPKFKIQTFTYYIPAPPARTTGYREKQFDKVFYQFINQGFEIISMRTQGNTSPTHSGMWVIFAVRALNEKADKLHLEEDLGLLQDGPSEIAHLESGQDQIKGLYTIGSEDDE